LFGASDALRETFGFRRAAVDQLEHERRVASVRDALEDGALRVAWGEGRAMTLEQAIEYALSPESSRSE
jgi:L-fucose isomerase-like protein